ncbi:MAG: hypothetical protein AAF226_09060 [Verrucomicrobiota bacterium]
MLGSAFERLGIDPALTLDDAEIDSEWRALSAEKASQELNAAREQLKDPASRLELWLQSRMGGDLPKSDAISPSLMDLFIEIEGGLSSADKVIAKNDNASTALAKSLVAKGLVEAQLRVQRLLAKVTNHRETLIGKFPSLEGNPDLGKAVEVLNELKFLRKWERQCQDRLLRLIG